MDWSTILGILGGAAPLVAFGWRIAHNTGKTANEMEQIKTICGEFKDQLKDQDDTNNAHHTRLLSVEKDVENNTKRLDRHDHEIHEIRTRRHRENHDG